MREDLPFIDEQPRRAGWIVPLLVGIVIGACAVGLVRADAEREHRLQAEPVTDPYTLPEPTEAVLWTVDVDGESAP